MGGYGSTAFGLGAFGRTGAPAGGGGPGPTPQPTGVVKWTLRDPNTSETYRFPINPDSMTPLGPVRNLSHSRSLHGGITTLEGARLQRDLDFSGVIRTQAMYDALVRWASKSVPVELTDHVGRRFRVYIYDFDPTDRSPVPRARNRWRYTIKTILLETL